ncbi:MAG: TolC family protein [Acidobacteriota bacterium]|nr:TolC family protein [Acidobacteriota bacterium]
MLTLRLSAALLVLVAPSLAEVHPLTLKQALDLASRLNPDVALARLDQQRSQEDIRIAQNPFRPKIYGGSGLAYTYGYPNSIEGNAPSLFQMRTDMALFNRPDSYKLAAAREHARGSQYGAQAKGEEVAFQAADLFLNASQSEHEATTLASQLPSLHKVSEAMDAAVSEGTELPLESKRATVNLAISQQRLDAAHLDADYYEMMLAIVLGYPATDRVKPVDAVTPDLNPPASESEAADKALENNRELKQMQSNVLAKELDLRSYKSARLPQMDLVAQYAFFLKQNYENYFQKFQANNYQVGASITIPLLVGSASKAMAQQSITDLQKIRIQMDQTRNRIIADTRRSFQQWQKATSIRDLSRMQLDLAREQLSVLLAQNNEGRVPMSRVEQARLEEGDRWIALYEAETQVTRAKLAILRQTGTLLAAVRTATTGTAQP